MPFVLARILAVVQALVVRLTTALFGSGTVGTILSGLGLTYLIGKYNDYLAEWWASDGTQAYVMGLINPLIADYAAARLGLTLDAADPFSNASLSAAISAKVGVTFTDIANVEQVKVDIGAHVATVVNAQLGAHFDSFYPVDEVQAQIGRELLVTIENHFNGHPSWASPELVSSLQSLIRQTDGVFIARTTAHDRKRVQARLRQRKYSLTHVRDYAGWIQK